MIWRPYKKIRELQAAIVHFHDKARQMEQQRNAIMNANNGATGRLTMMTGERDRLKEERDELRLQLMSLRSGVADQARDFNQLKQAVVDAGYAVEVSQQNGKFKLRKVK